MLKLSEDGSAVTLGWENASLDNQMGGIILIDGNIYGSGHNNKEWQCLDSQTGKVKYTTTEVGNGAVIYNDGLLYTYSQNGMVSILKATGDKFEVKGTVRVNFGSEQHWAHPVISNGILYIRHGTSLLAYNIKK
jgi:outer membrane protein assembly factor BamB